MVNIKTIIYFIRHAESPFIFGKEKERSLSKKGFKDAKKIAHKLCNIDFDKFISSSYIRAIQTLEPLAENHDIYIFEDLREKTLKGPYKLDKEIREEIISKSFVELDLKLDGGESTRETQERAIPIIKKVLNDSTINTVAIGTHGNILTCILNYFDQSIGFDFWKNSTRPDIYKCTFQGERLISIERILIEGGNYAS